MISFRKNISFVSILALFVTFCTTAVAEEAETGFGDGIFSLNSADHNYKMNIGARFQLRYWYAAPDPDYPYIEDEQTSTFEVYQARFFLWGHLFSPRWRYKLQLDFMPDDPLKDAYLDYISSSSLCLRMGRFKAPFSRQKMTSGTALLFPKRSIANDNVELGRDVGMMAYGSFMERRLSYAVSITNGDGEDAEINNERLMMYTARVVAEPLGEVGMNEARNKPADEFRFALGASYSYNKPPVGDLDSDGDADEALDYRWGIEAAAVWSNLFLSGEVSGKSYDTDLVDYDRVDLLSWYVQAGWLLIPEKLQVAARYAWVDPDTDNEKDGSDADVAQELTFGANYFIHSHRLLLQGSYSLYNREYPNYENDTDPHNYDTDNAVEHRVIIQLQLMI